MTKVLYKPQQTNVPWEDQVFMYDAAGKGLSSGFITTWLNKVRGRNYTRNMICGYCHRNGITLGKVLDVAA
jgi:hypothetical protein